MNIHQIEENIQQCNRELEAIGDKHKISTSDIVFISIAITLTIGFIIFGA